jgi:hypothetical protein
VALALTGCVQVGPTYFGPTGTPPRAAQITCSGPLNGLADCFYKAGQVCGIRGYQVVATIDKPMILSVFGFSVSPFTDRELIIECKADAVHPH